jgi:hypothetical protein
LEIGTILEGSFPSQYERNRMNRREARGWDGEKELHRVRWKGTRMIVAIESRRIEKHSVASKRVFDVIRVNEDPKTWDKIAVQDWSFE